MTTGHWKRFRNNKAKCQTFQSRQSVIDGEKVSKNDTNVRAAVLLSGAESLLAKIQGMKKKSATSSATEDQYYSTEI